MSPDDLTLLRDYTHHGSQAAFATLVARHVNLVYSVAVRQVRSRHLAEEVAQSVFVDLARHANRLRPDTHLAAWLHTTSRRAAIDVVRRESRRQAHEALAAELARTEHAASAAMKTSSADWTLLEPLLDETLESLGPPDRSAILLRFFENKNFRDIGAALGVSDDTAQKRVARALEKLRAAFAARGIPAGATATLASQLAAQAVQAAPAGLAATIAAAPAIASLAAGTAAATAATSSSNLLAFASAQKIAAGIATASLLGVAAWETAAYFRQRAELATLAAHSVQLDANLTALRRERATANAQLAATQAESARLAAIPEVELDAEVAAWLARVVRLRELAAQRPIETLPEFSLLTEKDWFDAAREAKFDTEDDLRKQLQTLRDRARHRLAPRLRAALIAFVDAHHGQLPQDIGQLADFASPPIPPEILARYEIVQRGKLADVSSQDWLIEERISFDETRDNRLFLARRQTGTAPFSDLREPDLRAALARYLAAHDGQPPPTASQLLPYFTRPPSPIATKAWLEKSAAEFDAQIKKLLPES